MMNPIRSFCRNYHYKRYKLVKSMILNEGSNLLDVGCGNPSTGMMEGAFLDYIGYGTGIDIENRTINFDFKLGNMEDIPFDDSSFDVVTALEVIEHINDPIKGLSEVHRVLKNNGLFVMSTPDNNLVFKTFWKLWNVIIVSKWKDDHINSFTKNKWERLIRSAGFKIVDVKRLYLLNLTFKMVKNKP